MIVAKVIKRHNLSERRACRIIGQNRSTQRYESTRPGGDDPLVQALRKISADHRAWGYKLAYRQLRRKGWHVNRKRVERLWRLHGLKAQRPHRRRGRVPGEALNSIWALPATAPNHVWAIDFKHGRLEDGRSFRIFNVFDEFGRRSVGTLVDWSIGSRKVQRYLQGLFRAHGKPRIIRTDNGPEFITQELADWALDKGIELRAVEVASPQQNGLVERFHNTLENELLAWERFPTILEARVVIDNWRIKVYNADRPHSSLNDLTPNEFLLEYRRARRMGEELPQSTPVRSPVRARIRAAPAEG